MASSHNTFSRNPAQHAAIMQELMEKIYQDYNTSNKWYTATNTYRPVSISDIEGCDFFPHHNNTFEGWFCRVNYFDGSFERYFIVDVSGSLSDDDWYIERIYC